MTLLEEIAQIRSRPKDDTPTQPEIDAIALFIFDLDKQFPSFQSKLDNPTYDYLFEIDTVRIWYVLDSFKCSMWRNVDQWFIQPADSKHGASLPLDATYDDLLIALGDLLDKLRS